MAQFGGGAFQFGNPAPAFGFGAPLAAKKVPGPGAKEIDMVLILNASNEFTSLPMYLKPKDVNLTLYSGYDMKKLKEASVVLVGGSSRNADAEILAQYVKEGGCVIVHSYCCSANYANNSCGGSFSNDCHPITFGVQQNFNHVNQSLKQKKDNMQEYFSDIMDDVNPSGIFPSNSSVCYRGTGSNTREDSVPLVDYNDGTSFLAYRLVGDGMVVSVNFNFCQSYATQINTNFWKMLANVVTACIHFRDGLSSDLGEILLHFESFEKEKDFVQCVGIVSKVNKRFNTVKKKLARVTEKLEKLTAERDSLEDEYQKGASMLDDLTSRIKALREMHECNCENWSSEEVCQWLTSLQPSWSSYADAFRENEVSGDLLEAMNDQELRTLGVKKLRDRRRILAAVRSLIEGKEGAGDTTSGPMPNPSPDNKI